MGSLLTGKRKMETCIECWNIVVELSLVIVNLDYTFFSDTGEEHLFSYYSPSKYFFPSLLVFLRIMLYLP